MKLASGRQIDEADCEILIRAIGIRTESELLDLIEQGVPADLRTPAMVYFAAERLADAYASTSRRHHPRRGVFVATAGHTLTESSI